MRFGASPQDLSRITAQAAVDADVLFHQTGDPADHLIIVVGPDGLYSTSTQRNMAMQQQSYSDNKNTTLGLGVAAGVVALGFVGWLIWRR